jgi:hypothetical protein
MAESHNSYLSVASLFCITVIFLMATSIVAYSLQNPTKFKPITDQSNSKTGNNWVLVTLIYGVIGTLLGIFLVYHAFTSHPELPRAVGYPYA